MCVQVLLGNLRPDMFRIFKNNLFLFIYFGCAGLGCCAGLSLVVARGEKLLSSGRGCSLGGLLTVAACPLRSTSYRLQGAEQLQRLGARAQLSGGGTRA